MNMKKQIILLSMILLSLHTTVRSQILDDIWKNGKEKVKDKAIGKYEEKTDKALDKVFDKTDDIGKGKNKKKKDAPRDEETATEDTAASEGIFVNNKYATNKLVPPAGNTFDPASDAILADVGKETQEKVTTGGGFSLIVRVYLKDNKDKEELALKEAGDIKKTLVSQHKLEESLIHTEVKRANSNNTSPNRVVEFRLIPDE